MVNTYWRCATGASTFASTHSIKQALQHKRINVSVSNQRSTRLDMEARGIASLVRASAHYYNSESEIDQLADEIKALA